MAQRSVEFTFKRIGCQGVHISTYTPSRLSDYTEKIAIPSESGYHVVGCYLPFLISNMNSWNIVERYMEVSERHP